MPRFFIDETEEKKISLSSEDSAHISKSLRMDIGDKLTLCDQKGWDYSAVIQSICKNEVLVDILAKQPNQTEPQVQITLYQALPKGDKLSFIVEKAVELGAIMIVPVLTSRCISRPDDKSMAKKIGKLSLSALEAAKQSERGIVPKVAGLLSFKEALFEMIKSDLAIMFYERAEFPLRGILSTNSSKPVERISILVGSEGGISPDEAEQAKSFGIHLASLGSRILRCETAPITALSAIFYHYNEF